jgi:hypothetical protein
MSIVLLTMYLLSSTYDFASNEKTPLFRLAPDLLIYVIRGRYIWHLAGNGVEHEKADWSRKLTSERRSGTKQKHHIYEENPVDSNCFPVMR